MKALSLREPWLTAVLDLGKNIENRKWNTKLRGRFALHAAKGMTRIEYEEACAFITAAGATPPPREQLRDHGIVGVATLAVVIEPLRRWRGSGESGLADLGDVCRGMVFPDDAARTLTRDELRWWMPDQFGFVLTDVVAFARVIPCRGALGFFEVSSEIEKQIEDEARRAKAMNQ